MKSRLKLKLRHNPLSGRARQLNSLRWLLVVASVVALGLPAYDLGRLIAAEGSFSGILYGDNGLYPSVNALVRSHLFIVLLVLSGWGIWLAGRRRHLNQIRLRRSEQKYRTIINYAGEAIFLLDNGGRILEWNKAAESLFGEPRRAVLGRRFRDVHLCYGMEIERAMEDARHLERSMNFEFPFPRPARPEGQVSLTISSFGDVEARSPNARTFVIIARDITSEKQLETRMSETEKLAGLGQLAAGTAHQLNTPLGSILLSAQMLEESSLEEDQLEDVSRIIRQTRQCRDIIKGLLNFARPSDSRRTILDLAGVIRETVYLMEKQIKLAGVTVDIEADGETPVHGNRNELGQVFFNLLANALDAMPQAGRVRISLEEGEPGENLVSFSDEGEGIPADKRDQVFLPFFTTKEYGKGTGLGLSIVARIIHEHGGRIELESEEGRGTTFLLSFPQPGLERPAVDTRTSAPGRDES